MKPALRQLMMEAHDYICEQQRYITRLELALACALPSLEEQNPTSEAGQAARLIRAAIDVKLLPLSRISRPTLIINDGRYVGKKNINGEVVS